MSATCSPTTVPSPATPADIDRSCRWPVGVLFVLAACWLVIASVLGFLASLKFHAPQILADDAWLTYGRLQPAAANAFLYGFAVPAGLGIILWMTARLGRVPLQSPALACIGALVWNAGLKLGLLGILMGDGSGIEGLELPRMAAPILFIGYILVGIPALLTFRDRREPSLYVSQWFLLAALFWFPWIFSTGHLLVNFLSLRGVMPSVVAWWYAANFTNIGLGFTGLAVVFYLLPRLLGRPLFSQYHAMLAFWIIALCGGWCGVPQSAPVPAWMPALSTVCALFVALAAVTVAINIYRTAVPLPVDGMRFPLKLVLFGAAAYVAAAFANAAAAWPAIASVTDFTFFTPARTQLFAYGFYAVVLFAAMYHILPRILGVELPSPRLIKLHAGCALAGITLYVLAMAAGGVLQGRILNQPAAPFMDSLRPGLMALRISTLGDLLLLAGHLAFLINLVGALVGRCRTVCLPVLVAATKPEPVEVSR